MNDVHPPVVVHDSYSQYYLTRQSDKLGLAVYPALMVSISHELKIICY